MEEGKIKVDLADLQKTFDALDAASDFHMNRDKSNAALHLAGDVRYSPLTSRLLAERDRIEKLIDEGVAASEAAGN